MDLEFILIEAQDWVEHRIEAAVKDGVEYQRKAGSDIVYRSTEEGFQCMVCGSEVEAVRVAHANYDGIFEMSGGGRPVYEIVPYCPSCEEKPESQGTPVKGILN